MQLLELQKDLKPIKKDSVNPHFKNSYFDINTMLAEVLPVLHKHGVALTQPIKVQDGKNVLYSIITDEKTIISESSVILPDLADPQKMGGAITYFRRYLLQSQLGLEAEDDDGNIASGAVQKQANQDFESQGLVRFNPPYTKDKDQFKKMTDFLKQNGGRFDGENKCWWLPQELALKLKNKFNQD